MPAKAIIRHDLALSHVDIDFTCSCGVRGVLLGHRGEPVECPACSAVWHLPAEMRPERGAGPSRLAPLAFMTGFEPPVEPMLTFISAGGEGPTSDSLPGHVVDPQALDFIAEPVSNLEQMPQFHPGHLLRRSYMDPNELFSQELAHKLFVPKRFLDQVLAEKTGVTPDLAMRLQALGWGTAEAWLIEQARWDLIHEAADPKMAKIKPIASGL